jgi:hypothetical protein
VHDDGWSAGFSFPEPPQTDDDRKAKAAWEALIMLEGMRRMWLPEHRVDCEWSDALTQLRQALEAFDSAALRRGRTFSTHLSRMVGSGKPLREQRLRDVEALRALARELSTAAADGYVATADGSERGLVVFGDAEGRDAARNGGSAC